MKSVLFEQYQKEIIDKLKKELGIKNTLAVPRLEKICINVGIGSHLQKTGSKKYDQIVENITRISGQKPIVKNARKSISNFKLREGMPVGVSVTLRKQAAYDFLYKLINIVYPRVRGFLGVKPSNFDKNGNCAVGFNDYTVFPEGLPDDTGRPHGVQVNICTSAKNKEHAHALLKAFSFPFIK